MPNGPLARGYFREAIVTKVVLKRGHGMNANRKRGLRRLAIAVLVPYYLWWVLVAFMNYRIAENAEAELQANAGTNTEVAFAAAMTESHANANLGLAFTWAIVVPIAILVIGSVGYWVYRGFRPKVANEDRVAE
jgi:fatty acid desaturase